VVLELETARIKISTHGSKHKRSEGRGVVEVDAC
jgi:hypothetical protein